MTTCWIELLALGLTILKLEVVGMEVVLVGVKKLVVQDESIRVAVLSITAAGTGLTLTVRGPRDAKSMAQVATS